MSATKKKSLLPEDLVAFSRTLRAQQTDAEALIWAMLRGRRFLGYKFRRQHPCPPFVLDFYCDELGLAIEIDGGQHNSDNARRTDARRTAFLKERNIELMRFWNHDVLGDLDTVLEAIFRRVEQVRLQSLS